jgi:hypothetical protein
MAVATPLAPQITDNSWELLVKILETLQTGLGSGGMSAGHGPPAFTPNGVTYYVYRDVDSGYNWQWTPTEGWF